MFGFFSPWGLIIANVKSLFCFQILSYRENVFLCFHSPSYFKPHWAPFVSPALDLLLPVTPSRVLHYSAIHLEHLSSPAVSYWIQFQTLLSLKLGLQRSAPHGEHNKQNLPEHTRRTGTCVSTHNTHNNVHFNAANMVPIWSHIWKAHSRIFVLIQ